MFVLFRKKKKKKSRVIKKVYFLYFEYVQSKQDCRQTHGGDIGEEKQKKLFTAESHQASIWMVLVSSNCRGVCGWQMSGGSKLSCASRTKLSELSYAIAYTLRLRAAWRGKTVVLLANKHPSALGLARKEDSECTQLDFWLWGPGFASDW